MRKGYGWVREHAGLKIAIDHQPLLAIEAGEQKLAIQASSEWDDTASELTRYVDGKNECARTVSEDSADMWSNRDVKVKPEGMARKPEMSTSSSDETSDETSDHVKQEPGEQVKKEKEIPCQADYSEVSSYKAALAPTWEPPLGGCQRSGRMRGGDLVMLKQEHTVPSCIPVKIAFCFWDDARSDEEEDPMCVDGQYCDMSQDHAGRHILTCLSPGPDFEAVRRTRTPELCVLLKGGRWIRTGQTFTYLDVEEYRERR